MTSSEEPSQRMKSLGPADRAKLKILMADIHRRKTVTSLVGGVRVGSDAPVVVQSMTNTDTADIPGTVHRSQLWPAPDPNWFG